MKSIDKFVKGMIILGVIVIIFSVVLASLLSTGDQEDYFKTDSYHKEDISLMGIDSISFQGKKADIMVRDSNDDEFHLHEYVTSRKDSKHYQVIKENNQLRIIDTYDKTENCFLFCFHKTVRYVLEVPKSYQKKMKISTDTGDMKLSYIESFQQLELVTNVGDIDLEKINIHQLVIQNDVGDIDLKNVTAALEVKNHVGDIDVEDWMVTGDSAITNDTGDIDIDFAANNHCKITAKTSIGEISPQKEMTIGKGLYSVTLTTAIGDIEY